MTRGIKEKKRGKGGLQRNDALLWSDIRDLILDARRTVARGVNAALVWTNFEIGRRIVEYEQGGKKRADYAEETLESLSKKLTAEFGRGYSVDNLERMRRFYLMYRKSATQLRISSGEALPMARSQKSATVLRKSTFHFPLSWSHYLFLKGVPGVKSLFLNLSTMNFAILDPKDVYGPDFPGETFRE